MRELSLFTGAGGGLLGTKLLGWEHIGYVEWNEYCQQVLAARIRDGYLPAAPIFTDVREFAQSGAAEQYRGIADVVSAGFPCQPFSVAGKQAGADDERNMWPATADVIRIVQPRSVLLENVPGLISSGYFGTVIGDLAELGYVGKWGVISAADCGAPHKRSRVWIVAHSERQRGQQQPESAMQRGRSNETEQIGLGGGDLANATGKQGRRVQQPRLESDAYAGSPGMADANSIRSSGSWWSIDPGSSTEGTDWEVDRAFHESRWGIEPGLGRVVNGVANRVDRLKALGNGQVSSVARRAYECLA